MKNLQRELYELVKKWLEGSIKKQDAIFNASWKNRLLFRKARKMANF